MGWVLVILSIIGLIFARRITRRTILLRVVATFVLLTGIVLTAPPEPAKTAGGSASPVASPPMPADPPSSTYSAVATSNSSSAVDLKSILSEINAIDALYAHALELRDPGRAAREARMDPMVALGETLARTDLALHNKAAARAKMLQVRLNNIPGVLLSDHPAYDCRRAAIYLNVSRVQEWMELESSHHDPRYAEIAAFHLREGQRDLIACRKAAGFAR